MTKFTLEIQCDNAAFDADDLSFTLAAMLEQAAKSVRNGMLSNQIVDPNGNRVGGYRTDTDEEPSQYEVDALVACATNEGDLYPQWLALAKDRFNAHDGAWAELLRPYARELKRTGRFDGEITAALIGRASAELRDYYIEHIKDGA